MTEDQRLAQLVQINPRSAILEAWQLVEESAVQLATDNNLKLQRSHERTTIYLLGALRKAMLISQEQAQVYTDLRSLRNQAAHATDFNPSTEAAAEYVEVANHLRASLTERAAKRA